MNLKRIALSAAAAAAVVTGGGLVAPQLASAGVAQCPASNAVCIWTDSAWSGAFSYRNTGNGLLNLSSGFNNQMSSWRNSAYRDGAWYDNANGGGDCHTMPARGQVGNVGVFDHDDMTSWRTDRGC